MNNNRESKLDSEEVIPLHERVAESVRGYKLSLCLFRITKRQSTVLI